MVAGYQDDVDLEDKPPGRLLMPTGPIPEEKLPPSSEEEAEEVAEHPKATALAPEKCSEPDQEVWWAPGGQELGTVASGPVTLLSAL